MRRAVPRDGLLSVGRDGDDALVTTAPTAPSAPGAPKTIHCHHRDETSETNETGFSGDVSRDAQTTPQPRRLRGLMEDASGLALEVDKPPERLGD